MLPGELLPLERERELSRLLPRALLCLREPAGDALLARLPGHAGRAGAGTDCEALVREPGLEDAADDVECAGLNDAAADGLATADADVDDALECEGEAVGGVLVEGLGVEGRGGARGAVGGGEEAVEDGGVFRGRGGEAEVVEEADEALEAAVHGHDLAYSGGRRGEVGEVGERVEQRQRRVGVERCVPMRWER